MFDNFRAFVTIRNCNIDLRLRVRDQSICAQFTGRDTAEVTAVEDIKLPVVIFDNVWVEYPTPRIGTTAISSMRLDGRCAAIRPWSKRTWAGRHTNSATAARQVSPGCCVIEIILIVEESNFGCPESSIICHPARALAERISHIRPIYQI